MTPASTQQPTSPRLILSLFAAIAVALMLSACTLFFDADPGPEPPPPSSQSTDDAGTQDAADAGGG